MKNIAIMQPYFFPYVGYWQLIKSVDEFIVYDDIQYTKKGWINRNRYLSSNGNIDSFSIPIKKDSDYLDIIDREIAASFNKDKIRIKNKFNAAYRKSLNYSDGMDVLNEVLSCNEDNLFYFIHNSLRVVGDYLDIRTPIIRSSTISNRNLKSQERVIDTCIKRNASNYINPPGGVDLYDKELFSNHGVELSFQEVKLTHYNQTNTPEFIPGLSILDLIMNVNKDGIREYL